MGLAEDVREALVAVDDITVENPSKGRKALDVALAQLAEMETPDLDLAAFAHQVHGSVCRANDDFEAADACYARAEDGYRQALAKYDDTTTRLRSALGWADLRRRWSFLCLERLDWNRGLELLDFAEVVFTAAGQYHEVGRVCLARGQLFWERAQPGDHDLALELLCRAVEEIDPDKNAGAFRVAEHNCATALTLHLDPTPEVLDRAFEILQRSRLSRASRRPSARHRERQRFGHAQLSVSDAKRRYLQGKVLIRLSQYEEARPFLETVRTDLMILGNYPRDVFAVTLDLAECYLWAFRRPWRKVADLLAQTLALCPIENVSPETRTALDLLRTALAEQRREAARQSLDSARRSMLGA